MNRTKINERHLLAVLVDIDGTLIDSNDAHARAWIRAMKTYGHEIPFEQVRPLIGKGGDKMLKELLNLADDSSLGKALSTERGRVFKEAELHALQPTPGARELLLKIKAQGLKVVVATSAKPEETSALLRQAGLDDLIDHEADSGDADQSKPDPDIVQSALRKADIRPSSAIMLGDTPYDIEAATKAGVPVIALRCGGWWNDEAFAGAVAVYSSPLDLLERFNSSPIVARGPA